MKKIAILGAGRSSSSLIRYMLHQAKQNNWLIRVCDMDVKMAESKIANHELAVAVQFDVFNKDQVKQEVSQADLIVSMLPASFHIHVIEEAINQKKNVVTPSYISPEVKALDSAAKEAGVLVMNELGVDPGIDHMSAMKLINEIKEDGGEILNFESFTGGLVAPDSDNNPWNYKFTWNPRNVVIAGQGGSAKFIEENQFKYIPYNKLFRRTEFIDIDGFGKFEGIANRDSLKYQSVYGLENINTIYRGTLRRVGFSRAWDVFVQIGATDDSYTMENTEEMTYRDFINSFLAYSPSDSVELKLRHYLKIEQDDTLWEKLVWLGIFEETKVGLKNATPAQILQKILEEKWTLEPEDKDMIVMWHKLIYRNKQGETKEVHSSMVSIGEDQTYTAMSNTVGLPVGICCKLILDGTIKSTGVDLPISKKYYEPILKELESFNISFVEKEVR
ncbi:MAG: saccharopine dehydrogenase C-terminal domain-containing protein [Flavobacteriales bacterium]|jgi:saccharopine dehydrogenase-like NADP-dependent oxidoreductase